MIKVDNEMFKKFIAIMEDYGECYFGEEDYLKKQLEIVLNSQGYWSGCYVRIYYNKDTKEFSIESRW